jgi:hypothetical protein
MHKLQSKHLLADLLSEKTAAEDDCGEPTDTDLLFTVRLFKVPYISTYTLAFLIPYIFFIRACKDDLEQGATTPLHSRASAVRRPVHTLRQHMYSSCTVAWCAVPTHPRNRLETGLRG